MATRAGSNLIIDSFAGYYGGWLSKSATDSSGYYFGKGSQYGPLCIKFKIPSISNFLNRNPTLTFTFEANGVGYYNTCKFTATIRTSNYLDGSKSAQGAAVSNAVDQSMSISANNFASVTTSAITINDDSVKADNSTYYYCWFTNPGGNYQVRYITGKVYYDQYTQCSAPTSVKFEYNGTEKASPYTHPSDNGTSGIKIKWGGAKAGMGMSIKGYTVQQYNETRKTWETQATLTSSVSSGSYLIPEGQRGESRTYRVLTIGTVSGYDSSASSSAYIYFNSKPSKPLATEKLIVSSDTTSTTISVTIPIIDYSFKTNTRRMTLYWKSSEIEGWTNSEQDSQTGGTWIYKFPVEKTPDIGQSRIYQFKMVDNFGDESDIITVTLTRSVPIGINSFTASLSEFSLGKMIVTLEADTEAHKDSVEINLMQGGTSVSTATIPWKSQINLLTEGPTYNGSAELTYKFVLKASDDFGKTITKEATNGEISVAALPSTENVALYNTLEGNNVGITEMGGLRFFQNIRAEFQTYTPMTSSAVLYIGDSSIQYTPIVEAGVFKFKLNKNEILNKLTTSALKGRIDFSFQLGTKIKNSFSKTIYFSPRPSINIISPFSTFEMYDQPTGTFQINGNFSGFGLKDVSISGGINGIAPLQYKAENLVPSDTNGYKIEGFNLAGLFPLTGFDADARQGVINKTITLTATNVLGVQQTAQTTVILDFRKLPSAIIIGEITYGSTPLKTTKLCEETKIQVPFTYTSYGRDDIHFVVYWNDMEKASIIITPSGAAEKDGTTGNMESLAFTVPAIPFGKTTANIVVKANLVGSSAISSSDLVAPFVSPYEDPGMSVLSSNLYNKTLTLNQSLNAQGAGTYTYKLLLKNEEDRWIEEPTDGAPPNSFILNSSPTNNRVARIQIIYTYPAGTTRENKTVISYSNIFVIFAEGPTVSYRKNQLGINTDSPDTECIIDIRPTSNYKKVRLYDGISDIIELDLSKVYNNDNNASCPAIVVKKETNEGTSKKITEYTLFFD